MQFVFKNNTKYIGHRGLPSDLNVLENTFESFLLAAKADLDGIETDIWPTKDQQFVCVHDSRPFKHSIRKVFNYTWKEIQSKQLNGSRNYPRDNPGSFTPKNKDIKFFPCHFEDYLKICKNYKKIAFIEIKNCSSCHLWTKETIDKMYAYIINSGIPMNKVYLISLDNDLLFKIKNLHNDLQIMAIIDPKNKKVVYRNFEFFLERRISIDIGDFDSPSTRDWGIKINKELIDKFHKKGLLVGAWTVNTKNRIHTLKKMNIDFVTSDYLLKE